MNKIKTSEPEVIWKLRCKLGEGTLWVKEHNSIYFVDIKKKKICALNIKSKKKKTFKVNKEIGFIAHVKGNIFVLGLQGEIRIQNLKSKKIIKSIVIEPSIKLNRTNDGKTDPVGNLWFGTMDNLERKIEKGSLYKLDKNLLLTKVDTNYRIHDNNLSAQYLDLFYEEYIITINNLIEFFNLDKDQFSKPLDYNYINKSKFLWKQRKKKEAFLELNNVKSLVFHRLFYTLLIIIPYKVVNLIYKLFSRKNIEFSEVA